VSPTSARKHHLICYARPREAIECYNHALLYADPYDAAIHLKIADIYYNDLEEYQAAAAHHRRVVEVSKAKGFHYVLSLCLVSDGDDLGLSVLHYARSAYFVGRYHVLLGGNDWNLAYEYLSQVAQSNAEEVTYAIEVLKELERRMAAAKAMKPFPGTEPGGPLMTQGGGAAHTP
jgi:anaphase-promoting complex subunit 8